ncbi:MAG: peptide-methionine (S)-S-oxide reductase [Dokdonella sp.]
MKSSIPRASGLLRAGVLGVISTLSLATLLGQQSAQSAERAFVIPAPIETAPVAGGIQTTVFAGGCFPVVQGVFQRVKGVTNAVSGYAGGSAGTARYRDVGSGSTDHAGAVRIHFDPSVINYGRLMQIHFSVAHDPTQLNRQGQDRGSQYRSSIFPADPDPLATTIESGQTFFPAEDHHQDYLTLNPTNRYLVINVLPKVENLQRLFPDRYRDELIRVGASRR